ncbi:uncharacterized protein G2W53_011676 [Senna tora]|uniref:Uncharacterized protein n=1 Tax=Senna tora TaxID=362788 RepID=A0A834X396_9FABA|nr:uncharacterized protein G2W53_011676 [Senna tora]
MTFGDLREWLDNSQFQTRRPPPFQNSSGAG